MTPLQRVEKITNEATGRDLSSWEKHEFLPSIKARQALTDKQEKVLRSIEARVFGESDE